MNPFDGLAHFFLGLIEQKKIQNWYKLFFTLIMSAVLTFLYVAGTALSTGASGLVSFGLGMVASAVVMTVVLRRSPLTKGMLFVLPSEEATKELETNLQVIQK